MIEQDLKNMSVYELRLLAREFGVRSPTSKSCNQIIQDILAIQNGNMEPFVSKKGRPPKSGKINIDALKGKLDETAVIKDDYSPIIKNTELCFSSSDSAISNLVPYNFVGVLREIGGNYYVQDYSNNIEYAIINGANLNGINAGDIICGTAVDFDKNIKKAVDIKKYEFANNKNLNDNKFELIKINSVKEMHNYIDAKGGNKIVVEAESSKIIYGSLPQNEMYLISKACDDVTKTYNVLLDVKNCVKKLCEEGKNFTLYLIDIEYIYYTLSLYFEYKGISADINAGQYFKELITCVLNSKDANIVILQKEQGIKSSYLELILNKYLDL